MAGRKKTLVTFGQPSWGENDLEVEYEFEESPNSFALLSEEDELEMEKRQSLLR